MLIQMKYPFRALKKWPCLVNFILFLLLTFILNWSPFFYFRDNFFVCVQGLQGVLIGKKSFHIPIRNGMGLPWWLSGKGSACQWKRYGFDPWSGKIPHAMKQLSPCTTPPEPVALEPRSCDYWSLHTLQPMFFNRRSRHNEKPIPPNW